MNLTTEVIDNIDLNQYYKFRKSLIKYLEIVSNKDKDKIESALVVMSNALEDINAQINRFNSNQKDVGIYYQLVIKIDFLIDSVNYMYKYFFRSTNKSVLNTIDNSIEKFKFIRSLTIAHPLETTRHEKFGFGKENDKWCEDILPYSTYMKLFNTDESADYIIKYKEKGKDLPQRISVSITNDFTTAVKTTLNKLDTITLRINEIITSKIDTFKSKAISARCDLPFREYVLNLNNDLKERYPDIVESFWVEDKDNEETYLYEHSILDDVIIRLDAPVENTELHKQYINRLEEVVFKYGSCIQNMTLESDSIHKELYELINPSVAKLANNCKVPEIDYMLSKICYLDNSDQYTYPKMIEKMSTLENHEWYDSSKCSNLEFALMILWALKDEINKYYTINYNCLDKYIYAQYTLALYFININ